MFFERVFTSPALEATYRLQLAKASSKMSMRLNSLLGLMYFLAFYRLVKFADLTWRLIWIAGMQLVMVVLHVRTALFLRKVDQGSLEQHISVKAAVVLASMASILFIACFIRDEETAFRGPFTTGMVRASVIAFQQLPIDVATNAHCVSMIVSFFIGLSRWIEVSVTPPYTTGMLLRDMLKCCIFCGIVPTMLTLWGEKTERRRFLDNWRRQNNAPPNSQVAIDPFWSKTLGIK